MLNSSQDVPLASALLFGSLTTKSSFTFIHVVEAAVTKLIQSIALYTAQQITTQNDDWNSTLILRL